MSSLKDMPIGEAVRTVMARHKEAEAAQAEVDAMVNAASHQVLTDSGTTYDFKINGFEEMEQRLTVLEKENEELRLLIKGRDFSDYQRKMETLIREEIVKLMSGYRDAFMQVKSTVDNTIHDMKREVVAKIKSSKDEIWKEFSEQQ